MMRALFSTSSTLLNLVPSPFHRSISHFYLPILFGLFRSSFVPFKWIPFAAMQIRLFRAWLVYRNTLQVHLPRPPKSFHIDPTCAAPSRISSCRPHLRAVDPWPVFPCRRGGERGRSFVWQDVQSHCERRRRELRSVMCSRTLSFALHSLCSAIMLILSAGILLDSLIAPPFIP